MRLLIDGSLDTAIQAYVAYPEEPTVLGEPFVSPTLPLSRDDLLEPATLQSLLARLAGVRDREVLLHLRGRSAEMDLPLVPGSRSRANPQILGRLGELAQARTETRWIKSLPTSEQSGAWQRLLAGLPASARDPAIRETRPARGPEDYEGLLTRYEDGLRQTWDGVSRDLLERMLADLQRIQSRGLDRVEFRGAPIGADSGELETVRIAFGCNRLVAPRLPVIEVWLDVIRDPQPGRGPGSIRTRNERLAAGLLRSRSDLFPLRTRRELPAVRACAHSMPRRSEELSIELGSFRPAACEVVGWLVASGEEVLQRWVARNVSPHGRGFRGGQSLPLRAMWLGTAAAPRGQRRELDLDEVTPDLPILLPGDPRYRDNLVLSARSR